MNATEIYNEVKTKGVFTATNEAAGWYAISKDGYNMITFADGSNKFYTLGAFAKRLRQLINKGH